MTDINPNKVKALELANQLGGAADEVVKRAHTYHGFLTGGAAPATGAGASAKPGTSNPAGAGATANKGANATPPAGKGATPDKAAAEKAAAEKAAAGKAAAGKANGAGKPADKAPAAGKGAPSATSIPADTKAPGGKNTYADVVAMLHKVQNSPAGRPECFKILLEDGGAAKSVRDLKPAFYDAVAEACANVIADEGTGGDAGAGEEDALGELGDVAGGGEQPDMGV